MIPAIIITSYVLTGLLGARLVYGYRIRSGAHDGYYSESEEEDTFIVAASTFFVWPAWAIIGLVLGVFWLITVKPPKSPKQLEQERDAMKREIQDLERQLGIRE